MNPGSLVRRLVCRRCLRTYQAQGAARFSSNPPGRDAPRSKEKNTSEKSRSEVVQDEELGPMARRLQDATEEALLTGGAAGRRAIEDAGFSDELKNRLLDRVADAKFRTQYSAAIAEAELLSSASEGTRYIALAQPWTGQEATPDAVLRMLDDAKKPLRPGRDKTYQPPPVDMRLKRDPARSRNPRQRAATARDKASLYADMAIKDRDIGLSDTEKEELRKEFRERFQPAGRAMPNTISGLTALANERIENAIARGQFKDIPRGKDMERDARADNPFIDTTEYILNKMIKRQDIVPPWIEKQQELVRETNVFRARLRNDWKRFAVRTIASQGGSLMEQMKRAEAYALAEEIHNPRKGVAEQVLLPSGSTHELRPDTEAEAATEVIGRSAASGEAKETEAMLVPMARPFRDATWESTEHAYMALSIENINNMARSYNLMAPDLAKKPYFSLKRELAACYADVAPLVAREIKERAAGGRSLDTAAAKPAKSGILADLVGGDNRGSTRIYPEIRGQPYGLRELWRDLFKKKDVN